MNLTASYSPNAQEPVQNSSVSDADGWLWGLTWRGTWGPFYAQADYVDVNGNTPFGVGAIQPSGQAFKVGGSWGYMPGARIGLIWVRTDIDKSSGTTGGSIATGDSPRQDGFTINWEHTFGNIQVMAQYGWTDDIKSCSAATQALASCASSASDGFMIGGRYFLSKRTWLYASYNQVNNDANQFADYTGGGITANNQLVNTRLGADPKIWALGIFHAF
jgi:predicted porin